MGTFNILKTDQPIVFTIDKENFEAIPAACLSAGEIAKYFQCLADGSLFKAHDDFFQTVLTEESYMRFNKRLNSKDNPITVKTLGDISSWLLGDEYFGGKSIGRTQTLIYFALDGWEEFDSWCLIHGVNDVWKLPSYRFGALIVSYLKYDKMPESIKEIDESLEDTDDLLHIFFTYSFRALIKAMCGVLSVAEPITRQTTIDNVVYDSRLTDLPIEEQKRQEAKAAGKPYRVPEWWSGEKRAYQTAKSMMVALPKKIGPIDDV